jgi:cytochrome c oxidase cbb3-type subunit III
MLVRVLNLAVLLLVCVASGALECSHRPQTEAEARGADVYRRMCSVCHGQRGEGYRADNATALANPAFLSSVSDGFLRNAIAEGRKNTTMSAWAARRGGPLSSTEVDDVVRFIRRWQRVPRAVLDERRPNGDAGRGERLFAVHCLGCHGPRGVSGPNVHIGDAAFLNSASNGFLRHAIQLGRPGTAMPAFQHSLGEQAVEDLLSLLRSWEPRTPIAPEPAIARPAPLPLGPVPLNPRGPEPKGFKAYPEHTSMEVVKPELERGAKMALLDSRTPSDYANQHIPGSVSVPFYDVERYADKLPKDVWLVSYCSCPHAESRMLAAALVAKGFKKVTVLNEGLRGWNQKHYPTRKGTEP